MNFFINSFFEFFVFCFLEKFFLFFLAFKVHSPLTSSEVFCLLAIFDESPKLGSVKKKGGGAYVWKAYPHTWSIFHYYLLFLTAYLLCFCFLFNTFCIYYYIVFV